MTTYAVMPLRGLLQFDLDGETVSPGVPYAPPTPSATAGNAQATVTWTAATSDWPNAVTGYVVTAYPGGIQATVGNVLTATVTGLTNGITYAFTVHAINAVGAGPESLQSTGVTPSATATVPGVPTSLATHPYGTTGVVTWSPPVSNGGSAITDYSVGGLPGGPFLTGGATSYIATGLTPGTTYTVTVAAVNSVGTGSTSSASLAIASTVPSVPQSLTMTLITAVSATLSWAAPATNGGASLTGYVISGHPAGPTTVGAGVTSLALTGLMAGTAYTMVVVATNSVGSSAAASTGFSTNQTLPTAPQSFVATKNGATEGLLKWEDPADGGGTGLIFYSITGLPGGTFTVLGTENAYLATGLTPGATYSVTVAAINHTGTGATASASFTTDATAPSIPLSLTVSNITPHTADLAWSTPSTNGGSAITGYGIVQAGGGTTTVGAGIHGVTAAFLSPGTVYTFSIYASNAIGDGPAASVTFVTTASSPVVAVVSPTAGTAIDAHTPLVVDVTDAQGLERVVLLMSFADLAQAELVHDGNRFTRPYQAGSTMAVIFGGGFRFTLQRQGGWPAPPTLEIVAYDIEGKEV